MDDSQEMFPPNHSTPSPICIRNQVLTPQEPVAVFEEELTPRCVRLNTLDSHPETSSANSSSSSSPSNQPITSASSSSIEVTTSTASLSQHIPTFQVPPKVKRLRRTKEQQRAGITLEDLKNKKK